MALFQFGRKKIEGNENVSKVLIVGEGKEAQKLLENVKKAAKRVALDKEIIWVHNEEEIKEYEEVKKPALIINDQVISAGRVLRKSEAEALLNSNWI